MERRKNEMKNIKFYVICVLKEEIQMYQGNKERQKGKKEKKRKMK